MASKLNLMQEAGEIAKRVLALKAEGKANDAGLFLAVESERLASRARMSYADVKQTVGFFLSVAASH